MSSPLGSEPYLHERVWFPRAELTRHPDWAIRHELEDGRLVRTIYDGPVAGEERYHYAGGVLVAIDEFHHLPATVTAKGWRAQVHNVGGRVEVGDGALTLSGRVIWRATDEPFADRLARVVPALAEECLLMLRDGTDRLRPVDAVVLQVSVASVIFVSPNVAYADTGRVEGPPWELRCDDDEGTLLREVALAVADPVTVVGEALAREVAGRRLRSYVKALPHTAVVLDGAGEASLRRLNPPESAERWLRRGAPGPPRGRPARSA